MIMVPYNNKDLASLYPKPKSYDEIERARMNRRPKIRSRSVAIKIGLSATPALLVVFVAYSYIVGIFIHNLSSMGSVFFGTFFAFFVVVVIGIVLFMIYAYINDFVKQFQVAPFIFYTVTALILCVAGYTLSWLTQNKADGVLQVVAVFLANLVLTTLFANFMFRQK